MLCGLRVNNGYKIPSLTKHNHLFSWSTSLCVCVWWWWWINHRFNMHRCDICHINFDSAHDLKSHIDHFHKKLKKHQCKICDQTFTRKYTLKRHVRSAHQGVPKVPPIKLRRRLNGTWGIDTQSFRLDDPEDLTQILKSVKPSLRSLVRKNWFSIKTHYSEPTPKQRKQGKLHAYYNILWKRRDTDIEWSKKLDEIFNRQTRRFKINFSHSFILYSKEFDRYRFYHSSNNVGRVLEQPKVINNINDFQLFKKTITQYDMWDYARNYRPDTKWAVVKITSTTFFIDPIKDSPIGSGGIFIPKWVKSRRSIITLTHSTKTQKPYTDSLCFFRCLALFKGARVNLLERQTRNLKRKWPRKIVTLADISTLENLFKINIQVYNLDLENECLTSALRSHQKFTNTIHVILHDNHFMYIKDFDKATLTFSCGKCGYISNYIGNINRHEKTCNGTSQKNIYPGRVYQPPLRPLELLKNQGVDVDPNFVYPYRIAYDFEAYQKPIHQKTEKTLYYSEHVPLSVSLCSNVPGFEQPKCFVSNGDSQALINQMGDYMEQIADEAYNQITQTFKDTFQSITSTADPERLTTIFERYLRQVPVVGFNSGKYDINMTKPYFINRFYMGDKDASVIKRNNTFISLSTTKFIFLDMMNFIAPGFNYANYLKAYKIDEPKGSFPHDHIKDLKQLEETVLPSKEAFYNSLTESPISEKDYEKCQEAWKTGKMRTLKDFLVWYNNKDVYPFILALDVQTKIFEKEFGLDMLKDGKSIPGLTLRYLFKTLPKNVFFSLFNETHKDLHMLLRSQIVGGPSLVFRRYHEVGITKIRNGLKTVRSCTGYDANSLYLFALAQNMPTEFFIRWEKDMKTGRFTQRKQSKFGESSREWLEWISFKEEKYIRHQFNGKEHSLGNRRIRVDGWDGEETVYQFHGCIWHGHSCWKTKHLKHHPLKPKVTLEELHSKTQEIKDYLEKEVGVKVVEKWECEWEEDKRKDSNIVKFIREKRLNLKSALSGSVSQDTVISKIKSGELFGLVQCDINTPVHLRPKFSELPPIFKNTNISIDDIGTHMKKHCETNKLMTQPRRTLISSYFGKGILLATPLLQWYIEKGLEVTNIDQIVEYKPSRCFEGFANNVVMARREGDKNPDSSILADTFKLLGNSAYGKTLEGLGNHKNVKYVRDSSKLIKTPQFRKCTPIDDSIEEVECVKKTVRWTLPLQIGYFVYQYAKLRMLQFYYDCLLKYVKKEDFELMEMDTDSMYLSLSGESLNDVIKPHKRQAFFNEYHTWFPIAVCKEHRVEFVKTLSKRKKWTPKEKCCIDQGKHDKRTPGLFKVEWSGDGCIALTSKTYICFGSGGIKLATKGVNRRLNKFSKDNYLSVLKTRKNGVGVNVGFRTDGVRIRTYKQYKVALPYLYIKRIVEDDGISTRPILL